MDTLLNVINTLLLIVIATSTGYIAYHYYRMDQVQAADALYENRLQIYRDVVQFISAITRDGDISRPALQEFKTRCEEGAFLFDQAVADYLEKLHGQASRLRVSNEQLRSQTLSIGEERDRITVENSKQLIWLADQLPQVKKLFEPYLGTEETGGTEQRR